MDSILKKGVLLVSLTGIMTAFPMAVHAADIDDTQNIPAAGNTQILEDCYTSDKTIPVNDHLVPEQKGEYSDMAFANVQSFLYIRSEPTTDSEWVGKLYPDYAAKITGPVGEWTKVESGNVTGYVYSRYITVGNEAQKKAEELVQNNDILIFSFTSQKRLATFAPRPAPEVPDFASIIMVDGSISPSLISG